MSNIVKRVLILINILSLLPIVSQSQEAKVETQLHELETQVEVQEDQVQG